MIQITGTKTISEQTYALLSHIQENKPGVFYWFVSDLHKAEVIKANLELLSIAFDKTLPAYILHDLHPQSALGLFQLSQKKHGIYLVSEDSYNSLDRLLGLASEYTKLISPSTSLDPIQLKQLLTKFNYELDGEGGFSFSFKGGTISIFLGNDQYKIVFDENGIETIKLNGELIDYFYLAPASYGTKEVPAQFFSIPKGVSIIEQLDSKSIKELAGQNRIEFKQFANSDVTQFSFDYIDPIKKDFDVLVNHIEQYRSNDYKIIITALDPDVIQTACDQRNCDLMQVSLLSQIFPVHGFIDNEKKILLLTHSDIFGKRVSKEVKKKTKTSILASLQEGDYIVHIDHGIAKYIGLRKSTIEGHERENFVLEYAKGDTLYVPVELASKIDKYIGEAKPKLQRLSGTSWIKTSRQATKETQEYAKQLLQVYAKRSLSKVDSWIIHEDADDQLHESFGYQETPDQETAIKQVYQALSKTLPADYLVVGDVGFGKTEVALRAAYQGVLNSKQIAILCPTTLLAQQHYDTFAKRLKPLGVKVEMLSRFTGKTKEHSKKATQIIEEIKQGEVDIIIGTHRLLSKDINFKNMGLLVIDEEQRFGVKHKERLKELRPQVHILTMSATPIPRTLYFALSGLREISTISTPPKGRQEIETNILEYNEEKIKQAIELELNRGGQVFYLYNDVRTMLNAKKKLRDLLGKQVKIDLVHGQMPESEMARVTHQFDQGQIDLLICSTIVENGIDIPNVNTLLVEKATKFGLGQLYQIRGRIGRGKVKAYSYFLYHPDGLTGIAAQRLQILQEAKELGSGMKLAMKDLELRGMGQLLGKKQHGKIKSVGLSLYGKLLRQAVDELESGELLPQKPAISVNLPFTYGIPEGLLPNTEERVMLYRQLSECTAIEDAKDLLDEFNEKILKLSQEDKTVLDNLLFILEIRFAAQKTNLMSIDYQQRTGFYNEKRELIEFRFESLSPGLIDQLYKVVSDLKIVDQSVQIAMEEFKDFKEGIKKIVSALSVS
jgi:transcription-repair coupling factor (superfamily II helicase)